MTNHVPLTKSDKILMVCTGITLVTMVLIHREIQHQERDFQRLQRNLQMLQSWVMTTNQSIVRGNQDLALGNQMLREILEGVLT